MLMYGFFVISKEHQTKVFYFPPIAHSLYKDFVMLTGQEQDAHTLVGLLLVSLFFLALPRFPSDLRNNMWSLVLLQKPSIPLWPLLQAKLYGSVNSSLIYISPILLRFLYFVIIKLRYILWLIQFFMMAPSILKLIVTSSDYIFSQSISSTSRHLHEGSWA